MPILKHFYITVVSVIFFVDNKQSGINNTLYCPTRMGTELENGNNYFFDTPLKTVDRNSLL